MYLKYLSFFFTFFSLQSFSQELKVENISSISIEELPEYVIVTSENTKLIGGINITIDYKRSQYQDRLEELESLLQNRRKLHIRNQTDLLNAMSKLGFEYIYIPMQEPPESSGWVEATTSKSLVANPSSEPTWCFGKKKFTETKNLW